MVDSFPAAFPILFRMNSIQDRQALSWRILNRKKLELEAIAIFDELDRINVGCVLIKGLAADQNYPADNPRTYVDIDIAVSAADYQRTLDHQDSSEFNARRVDLHKELRELDTLPWDQLFARSVVLDMHGGKVRIPCPEDHLRIMATHWLGDGGENRDRLWDIYYAVANRSPEFDWSKCLDPVSSIRRGWVICTIGLAHKYLDLDISDLPFEAEAKQIPEWVTNMLEKEWSNNMRSRPLQACLRDPKLFLRQLRKRIPPNPIAATIQMEAPIDERGRTLLQLQNIGQRMIPSIRRLVHVATGRR